MRHHIMLISIDALRADRLGCYGNPRLATPAIDGMAEESVVFLNATSPATWTLPGHMSMLSGLDPMVHGCVSPKHHYPPDTLPFPLIWEMIRVGGYEPHGVVGGGFMEPQFGFARGIENYHIIHPIREATQDLVFHAATYPLSFSFLHTYMVHDYPRLTTQRDPMRYVRERDPDYAGYFPTDVDFIQLLQALATTAEPPPMDPRDLAYLDDLYHASLTAADFAIKMLIKPLKDRRLWDDTTLLLTSDHGESLGEVHNGHQHFFHAGPPFQDQIRVPLLIKPARYLQSTFEPGVVEEWVSLTDLVPTLMDLMEASYQRNKFDGISLVDLCLGGVGAFETRRLFFHSCQDRDNINLAQRLYGTAMTWRDSSKAISSPDEARVRELYRLPEDTGEQHNRVGELSAEERGRINAALAEYWEGVERRRYQPRSVRHEDEELNKRLAALGYIDG